MKKICNSIFTWFSLIVMVFGFFGPNVTYVVNATEGNTIDGGEINTDPGFYNLVDGQAKLNLTYEPSVTINGGTNVNSLVHCYTFHNDLLSAEFDDESKTCTVTAKKYGKSFIVVSYYDLNNEYKESNVVVDIDFDNYVAHVMSLIPDRYEYNSKKDFSVYLNEILPNGVYYSFVGDEPWACYSSNTENCNIEIEFSYYSYEEGRGNVVLDRKEFKTVTIVNEVQEEYDGWSMNDHYVSVGESVKLESYGPGNSNDYFFVSEDNTIARIDSSNRVLGVSNGVTNIRLVNKKTMEYRSFKVYVNDIYSTKSLEQVLGAFNDTVLIDISNNLDLYNGYISSDIGYKYFNAIIKNINDNKLSSIHANGSNCAEGLNDCTVDYYYYSNGNSFNGTTSIFDIELRGVRVNSVNGHYAYATKYFVYLGETLEVLEIDNRESNLYYGYDTEYLEMTEVDGKAYFKALKEGYTKIDLYADGYMTSIPVQILFTREDTQEVEEFIESINKLDVPYSSEQLNAEVMNKYFKAYLSDQLKDNNVVNYLDINFIELQNDTAELNINLKYDGVSLGQVYFYDKIVHFNINHSSDYNLIDNLEKFKKQIKDIYTLDFNTSVKMAVSYDMNDDLYKELYKQTNLLLDLNSTMFTTRIEYKYSVYHNVNLYGGAYYNVYIYKDGVLVDVVETIVTTYFVVDRDVNNRDEEDLSYIRNYILDQTGLGVSLEHNFDNYYKVTYGSKTFNILYDFKDKIEAEQIYASGANDEIISVQIGETKQFEFIVHPFTATSYNLDFVSSNEEVFTIDSNGVITGVGEGIAEITYSNGNWIESRLVIVGQTVKEYLNNLIVQLPTEDLKVLYSSFDESEEESVKWAIERLIWDYEEVNGNIPVMLELDVSINKDTKTAYFYLCSGDICSDRYKAYYRFVGIYSTKEEYKIKTGQTVKTSIKFTEGDNSNLIFTVYNDQIVKVDKNGNITGLKKGVTELSVFDKYHEYFNTFPVYVDYEEYDEEIVREFNNKVYDVDVGYFNNLDELGWGLTSRVADLMRQDGFDPWTILGSSSYSIEHDPDQSIITYIYDDANSTTLNVRYNLVGVLPSNKQIYLEVGAVYNDDLNVHTPGEVTAVSDNTDICTVDGLTITTRNPGLCNIKYSIGNYSTVQSILVGVEEIIEELDSNVNALPSTLDLKLDEFDKSKRGDWEYTAFYDAAVSYHFEKLFPIDDDYEVNVTSISISETGDEINLMLRKRINANCSDYCNFNVESSVSKIIKVNYIGHSANWQEQGERYKNGMKEKYLLTAEQMMEFMFTSGDTEMLYKYSDFESDLEKVCPSCEYQLGGRGGTDGGSGVINTGFEYYIFKDGEPIAYHNAGFIGYIYLDVYEITDDKHIDREVKHKINEAYKKHKHHRTEFSPFLMLKSDVPSLISDEDDYEVELELINREGNVYNYDVKVDGKEFKTSVYLNILTKDKVYSNSVSVGDIDLDGNVNITDLVRLRKYLAGTETLNEEQKNNADVNKDGNVNITDLVRVRKYLAGSGEL